MNPPFPPPYPPAPPPPPKPPIRTWDVVLSIIALALVGLLLASGVLVGIFSLAFLDYCPPASCSAGGATLSVGVALLVAIGTGVAGLTLTILRLTRRRVAWPFAVGALLLCIVVLGLGVVAYGAAVGQ